MLTRRSALRGALSIGGASVMLAACDTDDDGGGDEPGSCEELAVDPDYDGGQLLYRRNDGGERAGTNDPSDAISEGQSFTEMIIKGSALYQTHGAVSHMETTLGPFSLLAPHIHDNADQMVIILGVVDPSGEDLADPGSTVPYVVDPTGSPPGFRFQFNPEDPDKASEILECPVGSFVLKPRGITHTFWNPTPHRIAYVEVSTGTDFEVFVRGTEGIQSLEDLKALEAEGNTRFEAVPVIARLLFEHRLTSIKGMGGIQDAVQGIKAALTDAIEKLAMAAGVPFPPELMDINIDSD